MYRVIKHDNIVWIGLKSHSSSYNKLIQASSKARLQLRHWRKATQIETELYYLGIKRVTIKL